MTTTFGVGGVLWSFGFLVRHALVILLLILGLMVTDLVADAGRIVLAPAPSDHWQFAGQAIARALVALPTGAASARSPRSSTSRGGSTPRPCSASWCCSRTPSTCTS